MVCRYLPPYAQWTKWLLSGDALPLWGPRQHTTPTPTPSGVVLVPPGNNERPSPGGLGSAGRHPLAKLCLLRWGMLPFGQRAQEGDSRGQQGGSRGIGGDRGSGEPGAS